VGCLKSLLVDDEQYLCIDQGRADTDHFAKLSVVPVFGLFNDFRPVGQNAPIEPLYLVHCPQRDKILLEKRTDVLFGFSIEYAREADIPLELLGIMRRV
jgi:hypothetical protein